MSRIIAVTVYVTVPEKASEADMERLNRVLRARAARWTSSVLNAKGEEE